MTRELPEPRSLDLCAIGLGQAGGNLAAEWRRRGHRAVVLNTAKGDLRALLRQPGLEVPATHALHIGLSGADGAGKDPEWGRACIREHKDAIAALVRKQLQGADAFLVCAGLGGGTGSAVDALLELLAPLGVPLFAVATLPSDAESSIAKVNAVRAANGLVRAELAGRVFIDNARLVEGFPGLDLVSYYPKVNARVLSPLDELNRLHAREDIWSIRSFDGEDLRKLLLSGGTVQTHITRLKEGPLAASDLVDVVQKAVDGGDFLAKGLDLKSVAYAAVVVVGPEKAMRATSMQAFEDAARELKRATGGAAIYEGLYVSGDDAPLRAFVVASSLALPRRVQSILNDAASEGAELQKKITTQIPTLDIGALDQMSLFRGASIGSLPPRPASSSIPPTPAREAPPTRAIDALAMDVPSEFDLDEATAPPARGGIAIGRPSGTSPTAIIRDLPPPLDGLGGMSKELTAEGTAAADSVGPIPSLLSAAGLQAIYEDLVEQYQKAPDKKAREKLARRLVDDGRADDVETRALAVWAMVKLADPSFRRALSRAAADDSPEISKLALTGLERMGGIEP